jgi:hypothetical protein
MSSSVPADLKYARSHEWVRINGDIATVGISDHAQHELTDVVFVELPALNRTVKAGEASLRRRRIRQNRQRYLRSAERPGGGSEPGDG